MINRYMRHNLTGVVYQITGKVKAKINSDTWVDAYLYMNFRTGEQFVTDKARIEDAFVLLPVCPDCNGGGMIMGGFCENSDCNGGYLNK